MVFNTALSGIEASSQYLDITGHNIANSATVGFKSSRAEFQDVYAIGSWGGGNATVGNGVRLASVQQNFGQGNTITTGNALDFAVNGSGFFVLNDNGSRVYTRAGQFHGDDQGYITNSLGQRLTGRLADATGNITNTVSDLQLNTANINSKASTSVKAGLNLPSSAKPPAVDWAGGASPPTGSYTNNTTAVIYDSLGNQHILSMYFIKSDSTAAAGDPNASSPPGTTNEWYVAFQIDNQDVPALVGPHNTNNLARARFNTDGSFAGVYDTTNTALANNLVPLSMNLNNGSNPLSLNVDLSNCTQFGSPFSIQSLVPDGYTTGKLSGISIDANGILFGTYSNGQSRNMAQLLLADFSNVNGLQPLGGSGWSETAASGQPVISNPGSGSLGRVQSGALEESNVDLTSELVGLITAQRSFQANAQTIKTADAITQTIINIS
jgi:flagellar hook protein FlgE